MKDVLPIYDLGDIPTCNIIQMYSLASVIQCEWHSWIGAVLSSCIAKLSN